MPGCFRQPGGLVPKHEVETLKDAAVKGGRPDNGVEQANPRGPLETGVEAQAASSRPAALPWSADDSARLYRVAEWGKGYFAINAAGNVAVRPDGTPAREVDLLEVVEGLRERGLSAPILVRFGNLLSHRIKALSDAFGQAIAEHGYRGRYIPVYPIKVNQQRPVVEEVSRYGHGLGFGLEVGSKPELLAVMALPNEGEERLIICNGFKDARYIEAVVLAQKLGRRLIPVVENFEELRLAIDNAERYEVRPVLGVRVKLGLEGSGRWQRSGGAKSKFGLPVAGLIELAQTLEQHGMIDCLELLHCHPGSQLQDIRAVKDTVSELAHVYAELVRLGAKGLRFIDVGGGLGVDYDGSRSATASSMNYSLDEYASEVVYRVGSVCERKGIEHPTIITESGRALAAYHSVLVFNVLGCACVDGSGRQGGGEEPAVDVATLPQPIRDLVEARDYLSAASLHECYHDAVQAREQALSLFNLGYLTLAQRAFAEGLFWDICLHIRDICCKGIEAPEEFRDLERVLCDTYFCNFSLFQSLPDSWAIDQIFPVMPIHRLDERPTRKAVLADITCDSDGRIDRFADPEDVRDTLDVHALRDDEAYYLAVFLVGAYQETLGDLHNLFGDTHVVHIRLLEDGGWWIDEVVRGDTAKEVLSYVQYDAGHLTALMSRACEDALRGKRLTVRESRTLMEFYESALSHYTYFERE